MPLVFPSDSAQMSTAPLARVTLGGAQHKGCVCHFGVRVISFVSRFSEMTMVNYLIYKSDTDEFICKAEIETQM